MARKNGFAILATKQVHNARHDGESLADGGGLTLKIADGGCRATFRYTSPAGIRREMGLGLLDRSSLAKTGESLAAVRELAADARRAVRDGIDPIEAKNEARETAKAELSAKKVQAKAQAATLCRVARAYHERVIEGRLSTKHVAQWIASLENNVPAKIWHAPIDTVRGPDLLAALAPLQDRVPETASRVRQRLEVIFADAEWNELVVGNAARVVKPKLREQAGRRKRGAFAALPFAEVPAFMKRLAEQPGTAARALEFAVLTASRTGEVLGAAWSEFDLKAGVWTVPAARMKGHEVHVVQLSEAARAVLAGMKGEHASIVFPSPLLEDRPLSNMAMLTVLRRMELDEQTTVHGVCRSSFSTWANELGIARPDVVEACLAHKEGDKVRAAYNRAAFTVERAALLEAWAAYVTDRTPASNVVQLPQKAAA